MKFLFRHAPCIINNVVDYLSNVTRGIALVTLGCFLTSYVAGPALAAQRDAARDQAPLPALSLSPIPPAVGYLSKVPERSGPCVINIQDLHCDPIVQRNIVASLKRMEQWYGATPIPIYIEGAAGPIDSSWLTKVKDRDFRVGLAQSLVDQGKLSGAEYYSIETLRPHLLTGSDDEILHRENLTRLATINAQRSKVVQWAHAARAHAQSVLEPGMSRPTQQLLRLREDARSGRISGDDYLTALVRSSQKPDMRDRILLTDFLSVWKYYGYLRMASVPADRLNRDLRRFMDSARSTLPYDEYRELTALSGKDGDPTALFASIARAEKKHHGILEPYRGLARYVRAIALSKEINPTALAREERDLFDAILAKRARSVDESEKAFVVGFLPLYEDFLSGRLTGPDYPYVSAYESRFTALWGKYCSLGLSPVSSMARVSRQFYAVNEERTLRMAARLPLAHATGPIIIITGGYHTERLGELVRARGIPFITVTPRVSKNPDRVRTTYESLVNEAAAQWHTVALDPLAREPSFAKAHLFLGHANALLGGDHSAQKAAQVVAQIVAAWNASVESGGNSLGRVTVTEVPRSDGSDFPFDFANKDMLPSSAPLVLHFDVTHGFRVDGETVREPARAAGRNAAAIIEPALEKLNDSLLRTAIDKLQTLSEKLYHLLAHVVSDEQHLYLPDLNAAVAGRGLSHTVTTAISALDSALIAPNYNHTCFGTMTFSSQGPAGGQIIVHQRLARELEKGKGGEDLMPLFPTSCSNSSRSRLRRMKGRYMILFQRSL